MAVEKSYVDSHGQSEVAVSDHADGTTVVADHDGTHVAVAHELADVLQAVAAFRRHHALGHHLRDAHAATVSETPYP